MRTSGNSILVTGASSGIGKEIAIRFAMLGNKVLCIGRNMNALINLKEQHNNLHYFQCDLSSNDELDNLIVHVNNNFSNLNILINCAGVQFNYYFHSEINALNIIEKEMIINFITPAKLCYLFIPSLLKNDEAAIINVSSILAIAPKVDSPIYCASKASLRSFTKSLRYQLESTNVKVIDLIPPLVDTKMTEGRGKNKISPKTVFDGLIRGMKRDKEEIYIGKAIFANIINRFSPLILEKIVKDS